MKTECDHTVGHLVARYSPSESPGSEFDLAADFADDETFAIYMAHHEMAKEAHQALSLFAAGLRARIDQVKVGDE